MIRKAFAAALLLAALVPAAAAEKKSVKTGQIVDEGSFGVYINGRRVATEKFEIQQKNDMSVATTELVTDDAKKPAQTTELELAPNGDLLRYTWKETSSKAQTVVEPSNEFLIERITPTPESKPEESPFLMPHSTAILDDYSFMQRQILAWRYLASGCSPNPQGKVECNLAKSQYGVIIPQQRVSALVSLEFAGREKVLIRGTERELTRINLEADSANWSMWLDDSNKVIRMVIQGENTEVLRD